MSRSNSGSTQTTMVEPRPSNLQFAQGGNPGYGHSKPHANIVPNNCEVDDLTLMMLQEREGRA
jgi:hypothetical protein